MVCSRRGPDPASSAPNPSERNDEDEEPFVGSKEGSEE
jgi:hypothetical protein